MKKILMIALTPLMTLSTGASVAQMPQVEVIAPALRDITRQQATEFEGLYWMSDGRRMKLWRQGSRIVASLDGAPNAELGLVGSHWVRSSNGRFDVRFTSQPDSPRTELTVTLSGSDAEAIVALSATPAR